MKDRQMEIAELVSREGRISVADLSARLGTSEVTVRKDLTELQRRGIISRERGYAVRLEPGESAYHVALHYGKKRRIAQAAADLVAPGETILVGCGSTCALLAEALASSGKDVNIVTNSLYLLEFLRDRGAVQITLLGGEYQKSGGALVGPLTKLAAEQYFVDKIFTGTDGFSRRLGFTGDDLTRVETIRTIAARARRVYLLAESEKFSRLGTVPFMKPDEVYEVITDEEIGQEEELFLHGCGVRVRKVAAER